MQEIIKSIYSGIYLSNHIFEKNTLATINNKYYIFTDIINFAKDIINDCGGYIENEEFITFFANGFGRYINQVRQENRLNFLFNSISLYIWLMLGGFNYWGCSAPIKKIRLNTCNNFDTIDLNKICAKIKQILKTKNVYLDNRNIIIDKESYDIFIEKCLQSPLKIRGEKEKIC